MRIHCSFRVDDFDEVEQAVFAEGGTKFDHHPGGDGSRVHADPAGHPFCLVTSPDLPE